MEEGKLKHFCTCDDLTCALNPNNPDKPMNYQLGCDPCIRKNLKAGEIPSCFFNLVGNDLTGVEDFTIDGFVSFYLKKNKRKPK